MLRMQARRRGEEGAALPIALAVLIVCAIVTAIIVQYASVSDATATNLAKQRNDSYSAEGALNATIKWIQSDPTFIRGSVGDGNGDGTCVSSGNGSQLFTTTDASGNTVTVSCVADPNSGGSATTTKPGFAILTLAPYHGSAAPTSGCINVYNDEIGIVQVQNSKLLTVKGNVYINSDADSDTWTGGCPNLQAAQHIQVVPADDTVEVLQRESNHDIDACPNLHNHVTDCNGANNNEYLPDPLSAADATKLQDPGLGPDAANWAANPINATPGQVQNSAGATITTCPAPEASGFRLVKFTPGTYNDANVFNNFMNGTCPNAVFWFQSGNYYFNFTNGSGGHEWTINDTTTRVVGGQPNGTNQPPQTVSGTWKPTSTTSSQFGTPNNAQAIDNVLSTATLATTSSTASMTLSGFTTTPATSIPADAVINSVRMRVAHMDGANTALVNNPTVTITPANATAACAPITINKRATNGTDAFPNYDVTSCLNDPTKINSALTGGTSMVYSVRHSSTSGSTSVGLDGIWLDVSYTTAGRPSWDGANPGTITASSPWVPGACRHDGDPGWNNGVQFVFGGDSRINLKSGKVELCNQPSTTKQEIVVYGARGATAQTATLRAATATGPSWNNPTNGTTIDGSPFATTQFSGSSGGVTRTINLSGYTPALNIDPASTNLNVVARIAHSESSTSRINNQQISILPAAGGPEYCHFTVSDTSSMTTQTPAIPAGCLTVDRLNAGIQTVYSVTYSCSGGSCSGNTTESLDGIEFDVTWTPPATGGTMNPASGCITQHPYYSPQDHSPAYNGACALLRVSTNANGGTFPRILTLWGTVYAPSAAIDVPVDIMTAPVFNRGVVARMLMLGYNVANNALVPITTTPAVGQLQNRLLTLTASIPGKTTKVVAKIALCDFPGADANCPAGPQPQPGASPVKILSWRITR